MMDDLIVFKTDIEAASGNILISEPMLQDESFQRSVVFICHHDHDESVGYVVNKKAEKDLSHYLTELDGFDFPLYIGGPVGLNSLHFIHTVPNLIGGDLIKDEFYWGGELDRVIELIKIGQITASNCKFFLGYSGWSEGQLEDELKMNAWLVATASHSLLFETHNDLIWRQAIESLGKRFNPLLHMPLSADLN